MCDASRPLLAYFPRTYFSFQRDEPWRRFHFVSFVYVVKSREHYLTDESRSCPTIGSTSRERNRIVDRASARLEDSRDRRAEDTVRFVLGWRRLVRCAWHRRSADAECIYRHRGNTTFECDRVLSISVDERQCLYASLEGSTRCRARWRPTEPTIAPRLLLTQATCAPEFHFAWL